MQRLLSKMAAIIRHPFKLLFLRVRRITYGRHPFFNGLWPDVVNEGTMSIGAGCEFRSFRLRQRYWVQKGAALRIGDGAFINDGVTMCATVGISIGDYVKIGDMTRIYDTNFHQITPNSEIKRAVVSIGKNVWIGANAMILAGSTIGDNSVIGAGAIVSGTIPANSLASGAPAKVVKTFEVTDGWIRS